jgi:hypothetical protein
MNLVVVVAYVMNDTATKLGFLDKCKIMLHTTLMLLHLHDQVKGDDWFVLVTTWHHVWECMCTWGWRKPSKVAKVFLTK